MWSLQGPVGSVDLTWPAFSIVLAVVPYTLVGTRFSFWQVQPICQVLIMLILWAASVDSPPTWGWRPIMAGLRAWPRFVRIHLGALTLALAFPVATFIFGLMLESLGSSIALIDMATAIITIFLTLACVLPPAPENQDTPWPVMVFLVTLWPLPSAVTTMIFELNPPEDWKVSDSIAVDAASRAALLFGHAGVGSCICVSSYLVAKRAISVWSAYRAMLTCMATGIFYTNIALNLWTEGQATGYTPFAASFVAEMVVGVQLCGLIALASPPCRQWIHASMNCLARMPEHLLKPLGDDMLRAPPSPHLRERTPDLSTQTLTKAPAFQSHVVTTRTTYLLSHGRLCALLHRRGDSVAACHICCPLGKPSGGPRVHISRLRPLQGGHAALGGYAQRQHLRGRARGARWGDGGNAMAFLRPRFRLQPLRLGTQVCPYPAV